MSREELILVRRLRKLVVLTSAYSVFLGLFMIYLVVTPLYVVEGVIKGYIALIHHELTLYGTPVVLDALSGVSFLSISLLILSIYLILTGILTLYLFFSGRDFSVGVRWLFGGGLSALTFSGLFLALVSRVLSRILSQLSLSFDQVTSAGTLYLGSSKISETYPAGYFLSPLVVLIVILVYVFFAAVTYLYVMMLSEYKLARQSSYRGIKYGIVGS